MRELESDSVTFFSDAQKSVRDFTAHELCSINQAIDRMNIDKELSDYCKGEFNMSSMPIKQLVNLTAKPIELLRNANSWLFLNAVTLTVNLEASDEQLINDFKSWLIQARKNFDCRTTEKMFTDIDFNAWCKYAILPYFDLTNKVRLCER